MMPTQQTGDDFASFSWHDNRIYGIYFAIQNWDADLALDIDYIVE